MQGRVVTSIPGAGICRVQGSGFDAWFVYNGQSSVGLGVRESGGLAAGTQVVVRLGEGVYPGVVLATTRPQTSPEIDNFTPRFIVDPPVSGYYDKGLLRKALNGNTWINATEHRIDGFMDLVAGEWSKLSPFGAYTNVEMFRAAMGAGPMSGVEFFTDTQLTRIRGLELDQETLASEDHRHRVWSSLEHTTRDWWTAKEAVAAETAAPRRLSIAGPIHNASQRYIGGPGHKATPRPALFQEVLGSDGTLAVTTAGSLVLQRVVDVDLPQEVVPVDQAAYKAQVDAALGSPRAPIEVTGDLVACTHAQAAWDIIDGITRYWARSGVDGVPQQWSTDRVAVQPAAPPVSAEMWGQLPRTVEIRLDDEGRTKKFFVGRSTFALLPDGSVLVENSGQAQIMLSGPNIVLSAPGDIILVSGGTSQVLAGRNVVMRAQDTLQLAANTGRVDIKAERQLSLLGGNDGGSEGVLVESRSKALDSAAGVGASGRVGGIVLKSATGAYIAAEQALGLSSKGVLTVKAQGIQIDTDAIAARVVQGITVFSAASTTPVIQVSMSGLTQSLWFSGNVVIDGPLVATGTAQINGTVVAGDSVYAKNGILGTTVGQAGTDPVTKQTLAEQITAMVAEINKQLKPFATAAKAPQAQLESTLNANVPLLWQRVATYGFSFMDTPDYGVVAYGLPETRWQRAARGTGPKWVEKYVRAPNSTEDTMPFPGRSAWVNDGHYFKAPDQVFFDPVTSAFTLSQPSDDPGNQIPAAAPGPLSDFIRSPHA